MSLDTLEDAFYDELCDVYHAEKQLVKALPKMAKKASSENWRPRFEAHLKKPRDMSLASKRRSRTPGKAAEGEKVRSDGRPDRRGQVDDGRGGRAGSDGRRADRLRQKVEHYEIATYGTLCTWADCLATRRPKRISSANVVAAGDGAAGVVASSRTPRRLWIGSQGARPAGERIWRHASGQWPRPDERRFQFLVVGLSAEHRPPPTRRRRVCETLGGQVAAIH